MKKLLGGAEGSWVEVVVRRKGKDVVKVFQRRSLNLKKKEDATAQQVLALLALLVQKYKCPIRRKRSMLPSR